MTDLIEEKTALIMKLMNEFSEADSNVRDETVRMGIKNMIRKDVKQAFEDVDEEAYDSGYANVV